MNWLIFTRDNFTGRMVEHRPTLDGKRRVFATRKAAEAYAYDYQLAGQRNQATEFRKALAQVRV